MNGILGAVTVGLSLFLLSVPLINRYVFHTVNVDAIAIAGREGLSKIELLRGEGRFQESRDSAQALIDRYRNDSLTFFMSDVTDWPAVRAMLKGESKPAWASLIVENIDEDEVAELDAAAAKEVPQKVRAKVVYLLNFHAGNEQFFATHQDSLRLDRAQELSNRLRTLVESGILLQQGGRYAVKEKLTAQEKNRLRRFQMLVIEKAMYPWFLYKDLRRGKDWASELIVQTAMYYIGDSYKVQFQLDEAIKTWNTMIEQYPNTVYAEVLFYQIGLALFQDGKKLLADRQVSSATSQFQEAIKYLEKIERNREIARQFPKYKYADLVPDVYVNTDAASKAKARVKTKTTLYTSAEAASELSGKKDDDRSGYVLEDAVKQIGEVYTAMGKTDSARMQYDILLEFFPESDNRDDAQKLIADSWVKDGDMVMAGVDTTDKVALQKAKEKAEGYYRQAIKEYLKFVNVYPQSDLISDVYIAMGDAYYKFDRPKEAGASFAAALGRAKEAEGQAKVQLQIGNYYFERKRLKEATEAYRVILNNFLSTQVAPNAQYMLGECYEGLGDTVNALAAYDVILNHYRSCSFVGQAAYKMGTKYFEKNDYKKALEAFKLGYTYDPDGNLAAKTQLQIGMVWRKIAEGDTGKQKATNLGEAIKQFKIVVDRFEGKDEAADQASYQIAECYLELENTKAAQDAVKRIQNRDLAVKSIKLFGIGTEGNYQEEADYWAKAFQEAQEDEERATALYEQAMVVADKLNRPEEAINIFAQSVSLTNKMSKKINGWIGIARAYSSVKRFAEAESLYAQLIGNPKVTDELRQQLQVQMYDCQYKNKKADKALEGFDAFVAQLPEHTLAPYAVYRVGTILADQQKYQEAMAKYQTVLDRYPKSDMVDKATLGIGEQMINLQKYAEAEKYLTDYVTRDPNASVAVNMYIKIAEVQSKYLDKKKEAVKTYTKVVTDYPPESNPYYSYASYLLGMLLRDAGEDKAAIESFSRVLKKDKAIYRASQAEAGKLIAKTDPEKAIENYRQIVSEAESPEDSAIALIGIGDVYTGIKSYGKAAESFKQVYGFYHGADTSLVTGALVKWADALLNDKKYTEVIKVAEIMQKEYPNQEQTIYTVYFEASAYFALERYAQARECLDRLIKMNKNDQLTEVAYYQKGDSYYFGKDYKTAIAMYDQYLDKYPKGRFVARALNMQGNCYVSMEEFTKSRDKFQQVVNNYPDFEEICVAKNYLAYSLNRLDQWQAAVKYYDQVIKSGKCTGKALEFARDRKQDILTAH